MYICEENALFVYFCCCCRARDVGTTERRLIRRSQITDEMGPQIPLAGREREPNTTQLGLPDYKIVLKTTSKSNTKRSQRARKIYARLRCQRQQSMCVYVCGCWIIFIHQMRSQCRSRSRSCCRRRSRCSAYQLQCSAPRNSYDALSLPPLLPHRLISCLVLCTATHA